MTNVYFSVVVPVFNAEPYIERCLRSLTRQTYPANRFEIIVVDNNSSDRSVEIAAPFERVRVLHEAEQGSYAARNTGIRAAQGEVVAFTDPDCEAQGDWLEKIALAMERTDAGIVLGDRRFATDAGVLGMLAAYESSLGAHIFATKQVDCYYAYTNNMAVRMELLKALGGFRQIERGADSQWLRNAVALRGESILQYGPDVVVRHLEISRIADYLRKKSTYARVDRQSDAATPRALSLPQRVELALQVNRGRGSAAMSIGFLGWLAVGAARFEWERLRP